MNLLIIKCRIILILIVLFNFVDAQTPEELKKFIDTYDKLKNDQQANEIVKKGIESEQKELDNRPARLLVNPADVTKYYNEKMKSLQYELDKLNEIFTLGDSLPPLSDFGYNFFSLRDSVNFIDNVLITPDYVLGYGDEVIISIWGEVQQYVKSYIQRDGTVYIENVGLLYLNGKSLSSAKIYVEDRFAKVYSTLRSKPKLSFIDVSLGKLKSINVVVSGHVPMPGNYIISPSMSIINLLIMSGGINDSGSLRNLYIRRNNVTVDSLDLYPLIAGLPFKNTTKFRDGDILVVPPKKKTIALTGAVRIPAYYEFKNDNIDKLLSYAGGLERNANNHIYIYRNDLSNEFVRSEFYNRTKLFVGDSLIVPSNNIIPKTITVSVDNGEIGEIPWISSLKYSDIFSAFNLNVKNIKKIELVRSNSNNLLETYDLQNYINGEFEFVAFDHLNIQLYKKYRKLKTVHIAGRIKSPGTYALNNSNETLNSIINRSGGYDYFSTINQVVIKRDSLEFGSKNGNIILSPGDSIIVNDFNGTVKVEGEVHNPGSLEWSLDRSAKDYLSLAGGITSYGDKNHITYHTPYGEAKRIKKNNNQAIIPGSKIIVWQKSQSELTTRPDRFQQISSIISSIVTIAILARTTSN